jgi:hypothetical protein
MPVMLCEAEAWEIWLTGSVEEALELQAPVLLATLTSRPSAVMPSQLTNAR